MKSIMKTLILMLLAVFVASPAIASATIDGAKLFSKKCKMCHALDKKKSGPAVKSMTQNESRLRAVITGGGKGMMKAYGKKLSSAEIDALVVYLRSNQVVEEPAAMASIDGARLFNKKCKMCHALNKKKTGPSITSMSQDEVRLSDIITNGGKGMMKAYGKKFSAAEIQALVVYLRSNQ